MPKKGEKIIRFHIKIKFGTKSRPLHKTKRKKIRTKAKNDWVERIREMVLFASHKKQALEK